MHLRGSPLRFNIEEAKKQEGTSQGRKGVECAEGICGSRPRERCVLRMICAWGCVADARRGSSRRADMLDIAFGCRRISADIQNRILPIRICDNILASAKEGDARRLRCVIQKMMNYLKMDGQVAMMSVISLCGGVDVV